MLDRMSLLFRFRTIAEAGSVRKASEILNVTQPALSRSLAQLEDFYDAKLLERHARGVRPTPFGTKLLSTISRLARDWELAEAELAGNDPAAEGRLRIHAGPLWSSVVLPTITSKLHKQYPNLTLEMAPSVAGSSQALIDGMIDVAFGGLYAESEHPNLETRAFSKICDRLVARADHPIQQCRADEYEAVHCYPWIIYSADPIYEAETLHAVMERTGRLPQIRVRSSSLLAIFRLLQDGDYLCILPDAAALGIPGRPILTVPIELGRRNSDTGAVYRKAISHYPPLQALMALCADYFETIDQRVA
ncbi:MAG: LysR family transcriptional regulator [Martelella sp.]|uniref:HTH-type transcriptional regulator GltR n=1 Tax=Martelella mediterranea DSM 17316 TaxID=1122214 RepID=A0A1U9Z4D1_9HYPH|nr:MULTISPECIES: LysR family transcriptional regulator [Martelella]AQZ52551.1 HTH-type transcriptional regulator GltR [Martelella mediterranea DSM 17316]MAU23046.1 LysR family transcriptional regulator [Martelella sp.]